jgi:hypothetical protein
MASASRGPMPAARAGADGALSVAATAGGRMGDSDGRRVALRKQSFIRETLAERDTPTGSLVAIHSAAFDI